MNRILYFGIVMLSLAAFSGCGAPQPAQDRSKAFSPFAGPKPVAVLVQTDPRLRAIGSDTPMIAIYEDGQAVYLLREKGASPVYVHKQLRRAQLAAVMRKIASFGDYSQIKRFYDLAPNVTGQPETKMYIDVDGNTFVTSVYGMMVPETPLPASTVTLEGRKADQLPKCLENLHEYLTHLRFESAGLWTPRYIEVMIWPYESVPAEFVHWPRGWPGLDSPYMVKRGDSCSIFLPGKDLAGLRDFLGAVRGAVEIGGKQWAIGYRFVFPSEPLWSEAFKPKVPSTQPRD
jgi:hypothetical protein